MRVLNFSQSFKSWGRRVRRVRNAKNASNIKAFLALRALPQPPNPRVRRVRWRDFLTRLTPTLPPSGKVLRQEKPLYLKAFSPTLPTLPTLPQKKGFTVKMGERALR